MMMSRVGQVKRQASSQEGDLSIQIKEAQPIKESVSNSIFPISSFERMSREGDGRYNSHDRGRDAYSGYQQDYRDRSRSRDSNYRDSGRGFRDDRRSLPGRRWRGGYGGDRRRGGSGGGRHVVQRPDSMIVKTNYYKIVFRAEIFEWIQYKVEIKPGVKAKAPEGSSERYEKNPDGTFKIVPKQRGGTEVDFLDIDQSSAISRRVLKKLSSELYNKKKIYVVTDGSATAYSPQEVLESPRTFSVNVKRDCEEDEDGADRVVNQWFLVTLTQVAKIIPNDQVQGLEAVRQAMDIILRSAMMTAGMTAFGRSPRAFHFPESDQKSLLQGSGKMEALLNRERNYLPLLGIMQAVRVCEKGNKYLNLDTIIDYANREFLPPTPERKHKVQLLDERSKKLCGVFVNEGFHRPITNPTVRKDIEKALLAININVEYKKVPQSDWVRRMKEKGKSDHEIERMKTQVRMLILSRPYEDTKFLTSDFSVSLNAQVRRNRRMRVDRKNKDSLSFEKSIIWSADDPNEYSFEMERKEQDPLSVTVRQYFLERHGITLRFPKMPLIYVGNGEWFPVEFLFQAFGKMKDANADHQKNAILDFCDKNAGFERVENISKAFRKVQSYGLTFEDITKQYNLRVYSTPVEVEAKVLKEPSLKFANDQPASINNGSWNLRNVKFQNPAELRSFALVDLSGGRAAETFVNNFLRVAASHGMEVPSGVDVQRLITRANDGVGGIQRAVDDAIKRARMYFFQKRNNLWFRTRVRSPNGGLPACLVLQNSCNPKAKTYGIMLPKEVCAYTHIFDYQGRENIEGRLVIKVQETFHDPFDFCPNTNDFEFYFEFQDQNIPQNQCQNVRPAIEVNEDDIECPSLVICILPDNKAERYGLVKMCCHFIHGVQSQCIDSSKFLAQRSKDQYCSNVALKINAKLSNIDNSARGWTTTPNGELNAIAGVTWIKEVHTLVLGISISNSLGHGDDIVSVISASASLDEGCMKFAQEVRVCTKTEVIPDSILSYLVKVRLIPFKNIDIPVFYNDQLLTQCFISWKGIDTSILPA